MLFRSTEKFQLARKMGIQVFPKIRLPRQIPVPAIDLSVLFGNLLDNAIKACSVLEDKKERIISVFVIYQNRNLMIHVKNFFQAGAEIYLHPKNPHGLGLLTVQEIVNAYHGIMDIHKAGSCFEVRISLFCHNRTSYN